MWVRIPLYISLALTIVCAHNVHQSPLTLRPSMHLNVETLIREHALIDSSTCHSKQFKGHTLAYVTPWNNRGYDVVKDFGGKFNYVSPVWYYIKRRSPEDFELEGEHDVDKGWINEVRGSTSTYATGKVVPRFQFRNWNWEDLHAFSRSIEEARGMTRRIMEQVEKYDFDGVVIECGQPSAFALFLKHLAEVLHSLHKELIVVLPPITSEEQKQYMNGAIFASMATYVDKFSLMTYDFSSHLPEGGPSSPIEWFIDNIEFLTNDDNAHKLLMGLNMYAMSYSAARHPQALLMRDVIEQTTEQGVRDIHWDKESREHWLTDAQQNTIWMPSVKSIQDRIRIAEEYGVGLSLWEVGQGLNYFYNIF